NIKYIGTIDENAKTISVTLPFGQATAGSNFSVTTSPLSSQRGRGIANNEMEFTVTAEDGSTEIYTTVTTNLPAPSEKQITDFKISYPNIAGSISGIINESAGTIRVELPIGTDPSFLSTATPIMQFNNGSINISRVVPSNTTPTNFTNPVDFTVTAQDGSTKVYVVTVVIMLAPK
ncbi:MAG: hypothetical protein ACEQSF_05775, partial [Solirubrobacteraceae bacterium]